MITEPPYSLLYLSAFILRGEALSSAHTSKHVQAYGVRIQGLVNVFLEKLPPFYNILLDHQ